MTPKPTLTEAQRAALKWVQDRGNTGVFNKTQNLLAMGEWAPFNRGTFTKLTQLGLCEVINKRLTLTSAGKEFNCGKVHERMPIETLGAPR